MALVLGSILPWKSVSRLSTKNPTSFRLTLIQFLKVSAWNKLNRIKLAKRPNEKSLNKEIPKKKSSKLKNRTLSGPVRPPQV